MILHFYFFSIFMRVFSTRRVAEFQIDSTRRNYLKKCDAMFGDYFNVFELFRCNSSCLKCSRSTCWFGLICVFYVTFKTILDAAFIKQFVRCNLMFESKM